MAEWAAYERVAGPIGPPSADAIPALHDAVTELTYITQMLKVSEEDREKVRRPTPYPRSFDFSVRERTTHSE
jgi:hypothetical protein